MRRGTSYSYNLHPGTSCTQMRKSPNSLSGLYGLYRLPGRLYMSVYMYTQTVIEGLQACHWILISDSHISDPVADPDHLIRGRFICFTFSVVTSGKLIRL